MAHGQEQAAAPTAAEGQIRALGVDRQRPNLPAGRREGRRNLVANPHEPGRYSEKLGSRISDGRSIAAKLAILIEFVFI